jgi:2-(1,2-epoxy-1,2-dihydrophenyl)acetyl-CoA isomerase
MADYKSIEYDQSGNIARITLNRPDAANSLNDVMARELSVAAVRCHGDAEIKAVILTGAGKFFSAGGDLKAMAGHPGGAGQYVEELADNVHRAITTFARMDAPLIIAVNGIAAGGGFSLAMTGDLVIACSSASFTMAYTKAGLSPDGGSSFYLPRLVGVRKTQELMFTNRTLSAQEALEWGLVNYVVPDSSLNDKVNELADRFVSGAKKSNAIVKRLLLSTFGNGLEEQMKIEARFIAECAESRDGKEGLDAFLGKRAAKFAKGV